ncbi:hypothetical protein ACET3Z_015563 [Daucus carota]
MHEYRLDGDFSCRHTCKEEWVICRIFQKIGEKKNGGLLQGQSSSSSYMQEASNSSLSRLFDQSLKSGSALSLQPYHTLQSLQNQNRSQLLLNNIPHEADLKSLITNSSSSSLAVSQASAFPANNELNGLQTPCSPPKTKMKQDHNLLKTLLPHQDYYCPKEQEEAPFPKICKTEANFSHFQSPHFANHPHIPNFRFPISTTAEYDMNLAHQITNTPNYKQSPLLFRSSDSDAKNVMGNYCGAGLGSCGFPAYGTGDTEMSTSSSSCSRVLPFNRSGFKQMLLLDPPTKMSAGESWPFHF